MPPKLAPFLLTDLIRETPDTLTYVIKPRDGGEIPAFKPGQFINLFLNHENCPPKMARAYSIASSPTTRDRYELTIKIQGTFPQFLKDLKPGHLFGVTNPVGHFVFDQAVMPHVVLLGAGVGVTPLMGILRYCTYLQLTNKITFINANKTVEDTIYHKELTEYQAKQNPHLDLVLSYTRLSPEDPWTGERGRIDWDMVTRHVEKPMDVHYFICGPDAMNKGLSALLIEKGCPKERVKLENMGF